MAEEAELKKEKKTIIDVLKEWSLTRKLSLLGVALISVLLFATIIMQSWVADYSQLFTSLSNRDAAMVVGWLKDHNIPYRLEDGGKDIMVPADKVYETRLELGGSGLIEGRDGYKIFDKQSFGMTDYAQKVNYRRALQEELTRTIVSLGPVEEARIHLALPEKSSVREQQKPATASIIVKLRPELTLKEFQLQGIIHLVAGSVEGLEAENVTVVETSGKVLSKGRADNISEPITPGMFEYQQSMERRLEARAQSLLDRALGAGNSLVRATVEVDFDQRERVEETFDPNGSVVVSEKSSSERESLENSDGVSEGKGKRQSGGNVLGFQTTPSSRSEEVTNYELSKVTSKTVKSVGNIKNLSVSVLIADKLIPGENGTKPTSTPRNDDELKNIEKMVRTALGINDTRGDLISVVSMPFKSGFENEPLSPPSVIDKIYPFMPFIKYGLLSFAALLVYLLFMRPIVRTLRDVVDESLPMKTVEEIEAELHGNSQLMLGGPGDPLAQIRQEVLGGDMMPVQVIKNWLREEPGDS